MINDKDKLGFWTFVFLWFGASVSVAEILTGGLLAPLGFKTGVGVIVLGHLIGTGIFVLGGIIGTKERIPAITSTSISFGAYGTYLFSILNVLQLIGWTAVMIRSGANSVNLIAQKLWGFENQVVCTLLIGALILLWVWFGNTGIKKLNTAAVLMLFALTIVMGVVIFKDKTLFTAAGSGEMSFGSALELNIIMPLSWLPLIADYTRFATNEKAGAYGSFLGYFTGSCWMYIIGLGSAILSSNADPSAAMLAANLGLTALGIIMLSTITTTFLDVYSAGISFLNLLPDLKEKNIGAVMSIVGTLVALFMPIENYESFLYAIGSVFAPLFAILITDYFIIKQKTKVDQNTLVHWGAVLVWAAGVAIYHSFAGMDFVMGATVPVMLLTGALYGISWRWTSKWKLMRKPQRSYSA